MNIALRYSLAVLPLVLASATFAAIGERPPNIVLILADDLGYGDVGCYGQRLIQTPHIDRLAADGMRFTHFYAGASVCAPSRCVLMTGKHGGHARVRGNAPWSQRMKQSLADGETTVPGLLKKAGYATALVGKWGLGDFDTPGHPLEQGFDFFFGYLDQVHAHMYFPEWLWKNREKLTLGNEVRSIPVGKDGAWGAGGISTKKVVYAPALMLEEALRFIDENRSRPFFLYFATNIPHANNEAAKELGDGAEVPDLGAYANKPWPGPEKGYAAMISYLDAQVGSILEKLTALGIDENTLVLFSSDNGPEKKEFTGYDTRFFGSSGPYRGFKRDHTDGGIRVPFIARWPGRIKAASVTEHVGYFGDFLATMAEFGGAQTPAGLDGVSLAPTLLGRESEQRKHEFLYWEYHGGGVHDSQAGLMEGRWKAIRTGGRAAPLELYDLRAGAAEIENVAARYPDLAAKMDAHLTGARIDSPDWPLFRAPAQKGKNARAK